MNAAVLEFGPGMVAVLTPIVTAATVYVGQRKTARELQPNHGSSLRDAIDRIEEAVTGLDGRMTALEQRLPTEELPVIEVQQ